MALADGFVVFVKRDCPTCEVIVPTLRAIAKELPLTVFTQDDPAFPEGLSPINDTDLNKSFEFEVETVPTLLKVEAGVVTERLEGWLRSAWQEVTGLPDIGAELPEYRPGCGSLTNDHAVLDARLVVNYASELSSRTVSLGADEDDVEAIFERGWTDGLPVVPPTVERVARMLAGTTREPDEIVVLAPPDLVECTIEKIAINAVMAGCKPEYLPVVIAAVEAACTESFNAHGLLCTTYFSGPLVLVNGPYSRVIGMNSGVNALGQGNRANATIGRALQLVIRNVGGGRPGEIDRATLGNPGKYTFCFAEREHDSPWEPFHVERGFDERQSTVTLFAASGVQPAVDQLSREPEELARSLAACLRTVGHPKNVYVWDAMLVVSPEHARVFGEASWSKQRVRDEITSALQISADEIIKGAGGIAEGVPEQLSGTSIPKFREGGLQIVHAGGDAGLFSAIIGGWASGAVGSEIITKEITL